MLLISLLDNVQLRMVYILVAPSILSCKDKVDLQNSTSWPEDGNQMEGPGEVIRNIKKVE